MSSSPSGQLSSLSSSNFKSILDAALINYKKTTGKELLDHPLATEVQRCDSVGAILAILRGQANAFNKSRDDSLMKWILPVVNILYPSCDTLGGVAGAVRSRNPMRKDYPNVIVQTFPPAKIIFTGIGILLAVRIFAVPIPGSLITANLHRRQKT